MRPWKLYPPALSVLLVGARPVGVVLKRGPVGISRLPLNALERLLDTAKRPLDALERPIDTLASLLVSSFVDLGNTSEEAQKAIWGGLGGGGLPEGFESCQEVLRC